MVSFSMCPIQLRLVSPLLLLLLLPPPPSSGAEPQPMHQERSAELEAIRSAILGRLGLSAPPNVHPRLLSATEVRRLQRRYEEALAQLRTNRSLEETDLHRSSGPSIPRVQILAPKVELSRDASNLRFHLLLDREALPAEMPEKPRLMSAQLWLFLQPPSPPPRNEGATSPVEAEVKSLRFDLTRPLQRWLRLRPGGTTAPQLRLPLALPPSMAQELLQQPREPRASLRLKFQAPAGRKSRRVRALEPDNDCKESSGSRCCARSQRVSFHELGWSDWILAPREYEMRFCEGSCPHNYRPASMHAQLKARLHSVAPAVVGPPCCAPSAYEPIVLMHYGSDGQVTLTPFEDLVPTTCHCA
ncbi:growth/differentiation factor 15-like [Gracilinanus agilis]|uniref:growth/differentiation factor 15-like n=1 Tax=Gracilinanus agilis TaxID=191870 RepID=UPI001CFC758D|nr:growth/differentiation factor 15-like [Gracilinanus agilis]